MRPSSGSWLLSSPCPSAQRAWTIVGGVLGAAAGYTVAREHFEVPTGARGFTVFAIGGGAIGALLGHVLGTPSGGDAVPDAGSPDAGLAVR